jgi:dTDP-4-dehydrorhamnose 3,5-epimerase
MEIIKTNIDEILKIKLDIFRDDRGFFLERFNYKKFQDLGLPTNFVQDNHSLSRPGVLRGLHYQESPYQGKLVGCLTGKIQDVAVDIRPTSHTYKKYVSVELSAENGELLWIPQGFAHGFCVLGNEPANVIYKTDNLYNPAGDRGIIYNDPDLKINWKIDNPILSEKDLKLPQLAKILS